jgi:hypothetical protein
MGSVHRSSGDHDGCKLADTLDRVAYYGVLMLYPTMSVEGPHTDPKNKPWVQTVKRKEIE